MIISLKKSLHIHKWLYYNNITRQCEICGEWQYKIGPFWRVGTPTCHINNLCRLNIDKGSTQVLLPRNSIFPIRIGILRLLDGSTVNRYLAVHLQEDTKIPLFYDKYDTLNINEDTTK